MKTEISAALVTREGEKDFIFSVRCYDSVGRLERSLGELLLLTVDSRYYQVRGADETGNLEAMVGLLQEQLKRNGFDEFTSIEHQCMHFDTNRFTKLLYFSVIVFLMLTVTNESIVPSIRVLLRRSFDSTELISTVAY